MLQLGQKAAIYCRMSTADKSCERQERDLRAFAERAGYEAVGVFKETGSGAKLDRVQRRKVMALAQARRIDAVPEEAAEAERDRAGDSSPATEYIFLIRLRVPWTAYWDYPSIRRRCASQR
jgi:hypothetical protein